MRPTQPAARPPERATTPTRMALWSFRELQTLRRTLFLRAGRLTRARARVFSGYIFSSRLVLPERILVRSSRDRGRSAIHFVPGGFATNG